MRSEIKKSLVFYAAGTDSMHILHTLEDGSFRSESEDGIVPVILKGYDTDRDLIKDQNKANATCNFDKLFILGEL